MTALSGLGWLGAVALLAAYVQVSRGRQAGDGIGFAALNMAGSAGLGLAAVDGRVWPSVVLNAIWILIGGGTLARALGRPRPDQQPSAGQRVSARAGSGGRRPERP